MARSVPQRRTHRSMSGLQLLHKASKSRDWTYHVDNRLTSTFGETDLKKRTVSINKKLHAVKSGGHLIRNADGTEKMIGTMVHEELHKNHPRMHEQTVQRNTKQKLSTMDKRAKGRLYARFRSPSK